MKWYEFQDDCGDGTYKMRRFKTRVEAEEARALMDKLSWFTGDGDGSPVIERDTDSPYFFDTVDEIKEMVGE